MYLLCHNDNYELIQDKKTLMNKLLVLTFEWCQDEIYTGPSYKELFDEAVEDHNFASIAQVFSIEPITQNGYNNFTYCDIGTQFCLKRIY